MPRTSPLLLAVLLALLAAPVASAGQRLLLLDTTTGAVRVVGDAARDETLYAIGPGPRPVLTSYRRTPFGQRSWPWVVQELDVRGRAVSRPRPIGRLERREYSPFEAVSPDGRRVAYPASDDPQRVNRDTGRGPVAVEVAGLRALEPRRVLAGLRPEPALGWSPDGRTLFVAGRRTGTSREVLWSYNVETRRTTRRAVLQRPVGSRDLTVGGDGRVVYASGMGEAALVDLLAGTQGRVEPAFVERPSKANGPLGLEGPELSPAGDTVVAQRGGTFGLELVRTDGRPVTPVRLPEDAFATELDWSPTGDVLAVVTQDSGAGPFVVRVVDPATGASRIVLRRRGSVFEPRWSPDGRWYGFTLA